MLYQSQSEINAFYVRVIQAVAGNPTVAISDWEFKSTVELLDEISVIHPSICTLLKSFLKDYQTWYDVHVEIDDAGTAGNLTAEQQDKLNSAINNRDVTRASLLAALQ